jgi:hypothetical protein
MKNALVSTKNFVVRNKTRILVTTTATAVTLVVIQARGLKLHNEFLEEHGLTDEFYADNSVEA